MITKFIFFGSIFVGVISLLYAILSLCNKKFVLNNSSSQVAEEEHKKTKAYRLQTVIFFLLLSLLSFSNVFRLLFNQQWITYLSIILFISTIVFYIVSCKIIKSK